MQTAERTSLAGPWQCVCDPGDAGLREAWWRKRLDGHRLSLPGTLPGQGIGDRPDVATRWTGTIFDRSFFEDPQFAPYREPGKLKLPFWLQPEHVFVGAAWYQREVEVPEDWTNHPVHLLLERPHGRTQIWWDDAEVGTCDSLSVPHRFVLMRDARPGPHRLTVRVDNRLTVDVGENAHSVSDHTQGNWNGIVGRMELYRSEDGWISDLQLFADLATQSVRVVASLSGTVGASARLTFAVNAVRNEVPPARWSVERPVGPEGRVDFTVRLGRNALPWDEFSPTLYRARLALENGESRTVTFGFRNVRVDGRAVRVNGRRIFLRGALDCCAYPKTGHPPMDLESWRTILRNVQAHGLNHVRFHSWCPPRAAFEAADELGLFLQIEASTWPNAEAVLAFNSQAGVGDGSPVDAWLEKESEAILREHGNHPSFLLFASGNEPGGPHHREYLAGWVKRRKERDDRRLYTSAAGWPELPENDVHVISEPRLHQWGDGLGSRLNREAPATVADHRAAVEKRSQPIIGHEIGQWCAYPPLYDTDRYTGYLKARSYELFQEGLARNGLGERVREFVQASGRLQALCYREEIETALRTPGLAGFQLLGLMDFPGQGTAPVGVLDVFGQSKGYLEAEEMRRYCGPTVLLLRLPARVFTTADTVLARVDVAHYGPAALPAGALQWELRSPNGDSLQQGRIDVAPMETGAVSSVGEVRISLRTAAAPSRCRIAVTLAGTDISQAWDIWVYPELADTDPAPEVTVVGDLPSALTALRSGRRVVWQVAPTSLAGDVALGFTPIFWNTWCTHRQAPHTLGLLCQPDHPALADFPSAVHSDWQWWPVVHQAGALVLDAFPPDLRPVVEVIDDWFSHRRLGLVVEAKVAGGRLLICAAQLSAQKDPAARQFWASLLRYAASDAFRPSIKVAETQLRSLLR